MTSSDRTRRPWRSPPPTPPSTPSSRATSTPRWSTSPTRLLAAGANDALVAVARFDRQEDVAAVLPSGATQNVTAVDEALRRLQTDGTVERLVETWLIPAFSTDPADLPVIATR